MTARGVSDMIKGNVVPARAAPALGNWSLLWSEDVTDRVVVVDVFFLEDVVIAHVDSGHLFEEAVVKLVVVGRFVSL